MTNRIPLPDLTTDQLDALYNQLVDQDDAIRRLSNRLAARTAEDAPELATQVLSQLLREVQTSTEQYALQRLAVRAGLLWRCTDCREHSYLTSGGCCGKPRPHA
ncbi:hypothetical protein [Streptomyces xiamenensis]|uniref:hypothetical protein n=1 Tax=Streptomyces xiamenensis TaxID=408015 RepID=UPI003D75D763